MSQPAAKGPKYVAKPANSPKKTAKSTGKAKQISEEEERRIREEAEQVRALEAARAAEEAELRRLEEVKRAEEVAARQELENGALVEVKSRLSLRQLRTKNLLATEGNRPDASHFKGLVSTITKCSAFARKCAKLNSENFDSLLKELRTLNLNKYVSELAANIAASPLKPTDLDAAVALCSEIHQLYPDFASELLPLLVRLISSANKTEPAPRRMALRLFLELFIAGIFTDQATLTSIVKEIIETKEPKQMPLTLQLILSFVRSGGRDILGFVPKSLEAKIELYRGADLLKWTDKCPAELQNVPYEAVLPNLVTPERRASFITLITAFYQKVTSVFLQSHKKLRELEHKNHEIMVNRHELPAEASANYSKQLEQFENFQKTIISLAELMHLEVPNLPQQEKVTRMKEAKAGPNANDDEVEDQGPWETEEAKRFYEVIPDLKDFVPLALLGIDVNKSSASDSTNSPDGSSSTGDADGAANDTSNSDAAASQSMPGDVPTSSNAGDAAISAATAASSADPVPDSLVLFYEKLMRCSNRQLIDDAALEFVKFNQKNWRPKLVALMHSAPRNRLDNLRYFSRFLAILNPYFKGMGVSLVKRLEEEFVYLYKQKDQTNSPSKIWNARFLGELTKFKICPPNTVLTFLKKCLDEFLGYNVTIACELVDTCGRYLLNVPETRVRTSNLLDQMASLKTSKSFHVTMEILIDNALQTARPIERIQKQVVALPPVQQYIQKLLYLDLKKDNIPFIVTQLRKMPWDTEEAFILKTMLKVYKNKYQHIAFVATIVAQLSVHHDQFGVKFLDHVLEEIRANLEERNPKNHQKLIMNVTLAGELINNRLTDSKLFYKLLHSFIRYNTITVPKSGPTDFSFKPITASDSKNSPFDPFALGIAQAPSMKEQQRDYQASLVMAWVEDSFRIRLVCTLLNTCRSLSCFKTMSDSQFGRTNAREMESFLVQFQVFLFAQNHITPELHSLLDDTWYIICPPYLFKSPEEAQAKLATLRTKPYSLPYTVSSNGQADIGGDGEDDENGSDDGQNESLDSALSSEISTVTIDENATEKSKETSKTSKEKNQEDELAKMFDTMMQDSMGVRTNVNTRANSIFSVPWMALKRKAEVIKEAPETYDIPRIVSAAPSEEGHTQTSHAAILTNPEALDVKEEEMDEDIDEEFDDDGEESEEDETDDEEADDDEEGEENEEDEEDDEEDEDLVETDSLPSRPQSTPEEAPAMKFQFLARRPGNKPVLGSINIPVESTMVKRYIHGQGVSQAQKEAMQAVTMKLHRMGEEAEAKREDAGVAPPPVQTLGKKTAPKVAQPTTYAAAVEALSTSVPRKTFSGSESPGQRPRPGYAKR